MSNTIFCDDVSSVLKHTVIAGHVGHRKSSVARLGTHGPSCLTGQAMLRSGRLDCPAIHTALKFPDVFFL
jgi:hypothetical protein